MKTVRKVMIELTAEEKHTLRNACEIITDITNTLIFNEAKDASEEIIAPECFWQIYRTITTYDNDIKLINSAEKETTV